jgi:hypothetical protein
VPISSAATMVSTRAETSADSSTVTGVSDNSIAATARGLVEDHGRDQAEVEGIEATDTDQQAEPPARGTRRSTPDGRLPLPVSAYACGAHCGTSVRKTPATRWARAPEMSTVVSIRTCRYPAKRGGRDRPRCRPAGIGRRACWEKKRKPRDHRPFRRCPPNHEEGGIDAPGLCVYSFSTLSRLFSTVVETVR